MPAETRSIPDYLLERVAAGDLDPAREGALVGAAASDEAARRRLAELAADDAATLARLAPDRVAAEVQRRARHRPALRTWLVLPLGAAVAVAALLVAVVPGGRTAPPADPADGVRVKGLSTQLVVHRRVADASQRLAAGDLARPGELLQLGYVAAERGFGVVVSVDGRGEVTRHWPLEAPDAARLTPGGEALLPQSFRLDDAPGFERFFLVTSGRPFRVEPVVDAARALARRADAATAPLPLPPGLSGSSVLVVKEIR